MSDLIERAKAELEGATPGPWATHLVDGTVVVSSGGVEVATTCDSANAERADAYNVEYERMEADARLIALAPDLARALIDATAERDALRERVAKLEAALLTIESITVHSGGEVHGVTGLHWQSAFEDAQRIAFAALQKDTPNDV